MTTTPALNDDLVTNLRNPNYARSPTFARGYMVAAASALEARAKEIEALRAALEPFDLQAAVYAAAQTWCGEKDRETFNSDIEYFRNNWSALKGLRPYVEREIGCRILSRTALKGA